MLTGQVSAVVGVPAAPTCIVLVVGGATLPDTCTVVPAVPPDPAVPGDAGTAASCTAGGADVRCAVTDASGNYEMRGLNGRGYDVRALPTDPEYLPTDPLSIQVAVSEVKQFAPVLNRKGRLAVTIYAPDEVTGTPATVGGIAVQIGVPNGDPNTFPPVLATVVTDGSGLALFTGLADGLYDIRLAPDNDRALTGRITSDPVAINQVTPATLVGTPTFDAIVGRIVTTVDGVEVALPNATVRVTGTGDFSGLSGLPAIAQLTTDANGCYAIVSIRASTSTPTSAECPTPVTGSARGTMQLTFLPIPANLSFRTVDVAVSDDLVPPRTYTYQAPGTVVDVPVAPSTSYTIQKFNLTAQPVPFGTWSLRLDVGEPGLSPGTAVTVTRKPLGAGNIAVSVLSGGLLGWRDDLQVQPNVVVPGLYQLHATSPGYLPADADLLCELGKPCRLLAAGTGTSANPPTVDTALTLRRLGIINGTIGRPATGPPTPLSLAQVQLVSKPAAAGTVSVRVDDTGRVTFTDTTFNGLSQSTGGLALPGEYRFNIVLSGYNTTAVQIDCDAGTATRGGRCVPHTDPPTTPSPACVADAAACNAFNLTLSSMPTFVGSVALNLPNLPNGTPANLTAVSIVVTQQAVASSVIGVTVNAQGQIAWRDSTLDPAARDAGVILAGTYTITASLAGYLSTQASYQFTCVSGTCGPGTIALRSLPRPAVTLVADPTTAGLNFSAATISITGRPSGTGGLTGTALPTPGTSDTATISWSDTALPYAGLVSAGDYDFRVDLPGYVPSAQMTLSCPDPGRTPTWPEHARCVTRTAEPTCRTARSR